MEKEVSGTKNVSKKIEDDCFICTCNPCLCDEPPPGLPQEAPKDETCKPCEQEPCEPCPPEEKEEPVVQKVPSSNEFAYKHYKLNEFMRAKQLLKLSSVRSGQSLYDHLASVIVKALDFYAPSRALNFVEEISLNVKRYRFNEDKDSLNDYFYLSKAILRDATLIVDNWQQNIERSISLQDIPEGESKLMASFPSIRKLMIYLEQVNVGLCHEEIFRLALSIRQFHMARRYIERVRFFGKVFGNQKPYYVIEAEVKDRKAAAEETWIPKASTTARYFRKLKKMAAGDGKTNEEVKTSNDDLLDSMLGAGDTFERAGRAVMNEDLLLAYHNTSGLEQANRHSPLTYIAPMQASEKSNEAKKEEQTLVAAAMEALNFTFDDPDAAAEQTKWEEYQLDLMSDFPVPSLEEEEEMEIPMEVEGSGVNRRCFYVCNYPGDKWTLLPMVTPQQINYTRNTRWYLTGNLNAKVKCYPKFPGREGHYLRALLARITAGSQVSPKGYYKTSKAKTPQRPSREEDDDDDEDEEDDDEEDLRDEGDDTVYPNVKFESPGLELWCHHTSYILPQGRVAWWSPPKIKPFRKQKTSSDDESSEDDEDDEEEGEDAEAQDIGPALFSSLVEDQCHFGKFPWTPRAAYTIFQDFQIAGVQSNVWPGATAICAQNGRAENIYIGDGQKFLGRSYAPSIPADVMQEYPSDGPELKEIIDPSVEEEQNWLAKLQLLEIADIEDKFFDNERPSNKRGKR